MPVTPLTTAALPQLPTTLLPLTWQRLTSSDASNTLGPPCRPECPPRAQDSAVSPSKPRGAGRGTAGPIRGVKAPGFARTGRGGSASGSG
ncbi:hypothetical protein SBD_5829 [Streptomyces bottropensis ATCC 25435]|uniref:Uncharacterized protein n=1 Tax=Streptomyces bottropensis ATCC 25435 TaxID=1054862 RepID=M3D918_9ACTN|nr:hypothetical protein SBD_5829 [Streptomyces bottropensis ATCC 25435]